MNRDAPLIQPTGVARRTEPSSALIPKPGQAKFGPWKPHADIKPRVEASVAAPIFEVLLPSWEQQE